MTKLCTVFMAAGVIELLASFANPVRAEIEYPWCAQYSGGEQGGGRNCGFSTLEQCQATVSGIGGFCERNLFYPGSDNVGRMPRRYRR